MKYFPASLLVVFVLITTGLATNSYTLNGVTTTTVPDTTTWTMYGDTHNEIRFNGHDNSVDQESAAPAWGSGIYQTVKNRIDILGNYNNVMQKNGFTTNNGDTLNGGTIKQDLYNYAYVHGDGNHVMQENSASATIDSGTFDAFIDQTATNLAYIGKGGLSSRNYLMQLNIEEAEIHSGVNAMILQDSKNVGTQEGNDNMLYQGPDGLSPVGYNYAGAVISGVRTNYDTVEQTQSNTAMQRGSNNKAFQENFAISRILDYDYNTITQTQKNALTQDGNWNILNQGLYTGNGIGSNSASALIQRSCKTEINQEQSSRGNQVGSNTQSTSLNMVQGSFANAQIIDAAWEYLTPAAAIDQNQKLIGTQGGSANNLYQNINRATAKILNGAGADISQSQMSRGAQGGSGNRMTQINEAQGELHWAMDYDDLHVPGIDWYGDTTGDVIEQEQRNRGEQSISSGNQLTQENHAQVKNYRNDDPDDLNYDSMYTNGADDHSVQIQSNDARENNGFDDGDSNLLIWQKNIGYVDMYGMKDETKLNSANVAIWKGTNLNNGIIDQTLTLDSESDPVNYDWNTDIIEVTAKNICQLRVNDPAYSVTMNNRASGTNYISENPLIKNVRWLNINGVSS